MCFTLIVLQCALKVLKIRKFYFYLLIIYSKQKEKQVDFITKTTDLNSYLHSKIPIIPSLHLSSLGACFDFKCKYIQYLQEDIPQSFICMCMCNVNLLTYIIYQLWGIATSSMMSSGINAGRCHYCDVTPMKDVIYDVVRNQNWVRIGILQQFW